MMRNNCLPIGVVQCASSRDAQLLFRKFVTRWGGEFRICGLIEEPRGGPEKGSGAGLLRSIRGTESFPLFDQHTRCENECNVVPENAVLASHLLQDHIAGGTDLVIVNKFGRLEANHSGLLSAFAAAILAEVPVITYVSPRYFSEWGAFASPLFRMIPGTSTGIDQWWCDIANFGRRTAAMARV